MPAPPVVRRFRACALAMLFACSDDATGPVPAPQVIVVPSFLDLVLGASAQLSVTVLDAGGQAVANPALAFESSDPARAAVGATGVVTALALGDASITVASGAARAYASVRIHSPAQLLLSPDTAVARIGDTVSFSAQALDFAGAPVPGAPITFESSNPAVITVIGPQGRIRAVGAGSARLRGRSGTTADSSRVTVIGPPAEVRVTPDSLRLWVADDARLTVQVRDAAGSVIPGAPVSFTSADPAVALVSEGVVRAVGVGVTSITATSGTVSTSIPVVGAARVTVTPQSVQITPADTIALTATAWDSLGGVIPGVAFTFRSTDTTVVRVSTTGVLTYVGVGVAYVFAAGGFGEDAAMVTALAVLARTPLPGSAYSVAVSVADAVYVTVAGDRLIRIDPGTWDVADSVVVGSVPTDVAFDNAGTRAYVTNQLSQSISEVDPATDVELRRIPVPGDPYVVTVAPGDTLLYVSTNAGRVYGVSLPSGTIGDTIVTGIVNALVVRDTLLYAGLPDGGEVRVYDRRTNALVRTLATGGRPQGLAFSPDGAELYVADEQGGLQFWNVASGTRITTLALATAGAFDVAVQPVTGRPFVTTSQGTVHAVDPGTRTVDEAFALGGNPRRIAFRANGDAIVANETGWVDVIR